MGRLDGKVAIITGAASGQGAYEAELFAKEGAKVVATDVQSDLLGKVVLHITGHGGQAVALKHNVACEEEWQEVVQKTINLYGQVDILVNNAGVIFQNKVKDVSLDEWNKTMNINSTGVFLGMKYVIPEMIKAGGGSIINISSIDSLIGGSSSAAYTASKGAVRSLTKSAAVDYAKEKVRVNSVFPGFIITPMIAEQLADEKRRESIENSTVLPFMGEPEDVAYGVLYLASDEARFVTGSELIIDGGYTAK